MIALKVLLALAGAVFVLYLIGRGIVQGPASPGRRGDVEFKGSVLGVAVAALALLALVFVLLPAFGQVPAGHRGVVLRFGGVTGTQLEEGLYVVMPLVSSVEFIDVQVQATPVTASAASRDLQDVSTTVTLNWRVLPERTAQIYQQMRREYETRVIQPSVQEAVKAVTAQFDAEELITRRADVRTGISTALTERMSRYGMNVEDVSITDFKFSSLFSDAIEAKVVAQQNALKAENDLQRIRTEAQQRISTATGEAEAIRIQAESISKQGGPEYVRLKAIEKWNGTLPTWMTSGTEMPFVSVTR